MTITESVLQEILVERQRQITVEGYSAGHDDDHIGGDLAMAAAAYAANTVIVAPDLWPWNHERFKLDRPPRRRLVIAAALIVAEIERLDRAAAKEPVGE